LDETGFASAGAALLLASDAGSFIIGTELVVDGGFNAMTI
jgi:enoyl-[acyl-carrier-protein] reductase (NADH)